MASLDNVSTDDLRQILTEVEGKKPTQRVMAVINYLEEDDLTQNDVAERYGYIAEVVLTSRPNHDACTHTFSIVVLSLE